MSFRKLSEKEKLILSTVELQATLSVEDLAKQCGLRTHTVRYHLQSLRLRGVLGAIRPIIDLNSLGYTHYTILCSINSHHHGLRNKLLKYLQTSERISWAFELGGEYHYGFSISAKQLSHFDQELKFLSHKFGNIFFNKSLSTQLSFHYYGRRYLSEKSQKRDSILFRLVDEPLELDDLDHRILSAMVSLEYSTMAGIARHLGEPLTTFERRRKRLEELGIIRGYFYWIDPKALLVQPYIVLIQTRGISIEFGSELQKYAERNPRVVYLTECLDEWDFEIGIEVSDSQQVTILTQRLYDQLASEITMIKVVPILNYLKFKSYNTSIS